MADGFRCTRCWPVKNELGGWTLQHCGLQQTDHEFLGLLTPEDIALAQECNDKGSYKMPPAEGKLHSTHVLVAGDWYPKDRIPSVSPVVLLLNLRTGQVFDIGS